MARSKPLDRATIIDGVVYDKGDILPAEVAARLGAGPAASPPEVAAAVDPSQIPAPDGPAADLPWLDPDAAPPES